MTNVAIVVFDGLQPAQVTPELMPNLYRFAAEGVTGDNHHAVFPTVTRANVASIVTGHHPGAHGLTGNMLVIPEFDPHRAINALEPTLTEVAASHPVLLQPTIGDILYRHGQEYVAVGTGTSGNAYLQNPNAETGGGATIHPDFCLPRALHGALMERFGPWPDRREPSAVKMARAVDIVHRVCPYGAPPCRIAAVVLRTRFIPARPRRRFGGVYRLHPGSRCTVRATPGMA